VAEAVAYLQTFVTLVVINHELKGKHLDACVDVAHAGSDDALQIRLGLTGARGATGRDPVGPRQTSHGSILVAVILVTKDVTKEQPKGGHRRLGTSDWTGGSNFRANAEIPRAGSS
jgi:hypothetical protein